MYIALTMPCMATPDQSWHQSPLALSSVLYSIFINKDKAYIVAPHVFRINLKMNIMAALLHEISLNALTVLLLLLLLLIMDTHNTKIQKYA